MPLPTLLAALALAIFTSPAFAHGDHGDHAQAPIVAPNADWATRHMAEEHGISVFDSGVFFALHDYDSSGYWSSDNIRRTYGLFDKSNDHVSSDAKTAAVRRVVDLYDVNKDGTVSRDEFLSATANGVQLPDLGYGPGHHGDDEWEYEIHHWRKYHDGEDVREEDLTHPEDIEHFKWHDEEERRKEVWEEKVENAVGGVVEENIPVMFRRQSST